MLGFLKWFVSRVGYNIALSLRRSWVRFPYEPRLELLYLLPIFINMGRKQKNYHYIYKTMNLLNGKYYIGMHTTDNLNDGYIGSGKKLWYSIKKYGKENFKCEILEMLPDRSSLKKREIELVNEELLKDSQCMNLTLGGGDGFYYINKNGINNKSNQFFLGGKSSAEKLRTDTEWRERHRKISSETMKKNHKLGKIRYNTFVGKTHKEESKKKIGESNSLKQRGENNSQFGTCWITNGEENKKIIKNDTIPYGWKLGRVTKK